ncbi:MAG: 2OG-Fe(II) oxygenase [Deltaproteobacteria bacterium]|nr:2OG-Fe(II) oxygenase [Deltaproteobacteria bacterium]
MANLTSELAQILQRVQRPGDFYTTDTLDLFAPRLEVAGVGPIALPLLPAQAQQLIAVAEPAPYGRGEATVVDPAVRRTWQIAPERVQISGRHWKQTLADIVARATSGLGVTEPVVADFYKLLVYDTDSFFVNHRDTEKAAGMFATLLIVLPSIYTGGALLVRHRDREVRLELNCTEVSQVAFAAFYADCVHEVLPLTSGYRLVLVYNLRRQGRGQLPHAPDYDTEQAEVTALLRQWSAGKEAADDDAPAKVLYPLEHAYTPAELAFAALKGADAAAAAVLVAAASAADCDLHLALVTIGESGSAEYTGYSGSRRRRWAADDEDEEDDEDFEIGEVHDRTETLSDWRHPDGSQPTLGPLPFTEDELCPPEAFEELEPDEQHFHEATGNEGASFVRTYRRAALVVWPRARRLAVLNQAGLTATLPYLTGLTERWAASGEGLSSALWREAHELAGHMLETWPRQVGWSYGKNDTPGNTTTLLNLLSQLQDTARIDTFLDILATAALSKGDNAAIVQAASLLSPKRAAVLIKHIISSHAATNLSACADLLARSVAASVPRGAVNLRGAATALVEALPGDPARAPQRDPWIRALPVEPGSLIDLVTALGQIDAALANQVADHILAWPKTYDPDAVLIPTVLGLIGTTAPKAQAAIQRLRSAALEHLRARIATPLEPPRDWARASKIACTCAHCRELSTFLKDPKQKQWTLKAPETGRRHVEDSIRRHGCDLDVMTNRQGRPYSLVCTKNQASYERRARQRQEDLAHQARLQV